MNPAQGAIDPFQGPSFLNLGTTGLTSSGLEWFLPIIFTIVFALWLAYTIVVVYHWLRYGHLSLIAIPMIAVHVVVSGTILLLATSGLR